MNQKNKAEFLKATGFHTVNVYVLKSFQENKNFVVYGLFHETNDLQYSQNIV